MSNAPSLPPLSLPTFSSSKVIPVSVADLTPVAEEVMEHFRIQGYDVAGERTATRGWHISIAKGTIFAAVLGMKTALNIEVEPAPNATLAKAGIGIFGRQVIPVLLARFVAWPVWLTQVWGLVQQARLDDEALECVERSVYAHSTRVTPVEPSAPAAGAASGEQAKFCTDCGARLPRAARFCSECGARAE